MKNNTNNVRRYTTTQKMKIIGRCRYIRIVKNKKYLTDSDVYLPIKKDGRIVYIIADGY